MGIGDRLKEERLRLGLNQSDFAALAQVTKNSQLNYEKGDRSPDAEYLAAVAGAGVDVLYVVTGERKPTQAESISAEEAALIARYRELPEADRAAMARMATAMAEMTARTDH